MDSLVLLRTALYKKCHKQVIHAVNLNEQKNKKSNLCSFRARTRLIFSKIVVNRHVKMELHFYFCDAVRKRLYCFPFFLLLTHTFQSFQMYLTHFLSLIILYEYLRGLNEYANFFTKFENLTAIIITGKPTNCTGNSKTGSWARTDFSVRSIDIKNT